MELQGQGEVRCIHHVLKTFCMHRSEPTLNSKGHRSIVGPGIGVVLHLAHDADLSICHNRGLQGDTAANAVGAVWVANCHFCADPRELADACVESPGAILNVP